MATSQDDQNSNVSAADAEKLSQALFSQIAELELSPGPFLKTRILAHQKEIDSKKIRIAWWKKSAIGAFSLAILFAFSSLFLNFKYEALVNQTMAIRIDTKAVGKDLGKVAYVRIELPDGVNFQSKSYPDLAKLNSLTLAWNASQSIDKIPILIRSFQGGTKEVNVSFLDNNSRLLSSEKIHIRFKTEASSKKGII